MNKHRNVGKVFSYKKGESFDGDDRSVRRIEDIIWTRSKENENGFPIIQKPFKIRIVVEDE